MAIKGKSLKLKAWSKKDLALVITVYIINEIVFTLLFAGVCVLNAVSEDADAYSVLTSSAVVDFAVIISLILAITAVYFFFEDRDFLRKASNSQMLFLIWEAGAAICFISGTFLNPYVRPLALVAVLTLFLTNSGTAIFSNFVFSVVMFVFDAFSNTLASFTPFSIVFFFAVGLFSGIIAVYCMKGLYSRLKIILISFLISLPSLVCIILPMVDFGGGNFALNLLSGALSGPFSAAAFIILLPVFEGLFKKITNFKLSELTDHKARLIRKLITQAPGTFNHSIIVSNIAEACATAIGEDALLARTCAYYHDVGKLRRPEFFKENQADSVNPHNDLTPELSANIIRSHTQDGYLFALKNRLPQEIADICLQHHGTMPMLFFYDKAKKFTDGEVSLANYCYSGPKPQSKIAAIIMIADGAEAVVRSLKTRTRDTVSAAVKKIVSERMQLGQFDECELTLKEINIIIQTVVNSLSGVYHDRIKYPKVSLEGVDFDEEHVKDEQ
ncbi:MAG: HDIG domain-containing protein [Clostridia bacterium]|nr:HDIG domain-containing protein [Clostridia bacterium]